MPIEKEKFNSVIDLIREKLGDANSALVSEDLLSLVSSFNTSVDDYNSLNETSQKLKKENEELLKVNGRLFQKIGFDTPKEKEKEIEKDDNEIDISTIINSKGEFI